MKKIHEYYRIVLNLISKFELLPTPEVYAVLFEYASGRSKSLSEEINNLIEKNELTTDKLTSLYHSHFHVSNKAIIKEVVSTIKNIISKLLSSISTTDSSINNSIDNLAELENKIKNSSSLKEIEKAVNNVINEIKLVRENGLQLNSELESSKNNFKSVEKELEKLRAEVRSDALTGLLNRRGFEEELIKKINDPDIKEISLIFADIDNFKEINDKYGHLVGDEVLKYVASFLMEYTKGKDIVARFGGEEFIILVTDTPFKDVLTLTEHLRSIISEKKLIVKRTKERLKPITLSFGVAKYRKGEPIEEFIDRADKAMYYAKTHGKNKVVSEEVLDL